MIIKYYLAHPSRNLLVVRRGLLKYYLLVHLRNTIQIKFLTNWYSSSPPIFLNLDFLPKIFLPIPLFPIWYSSQQPLYYRDETTLYTLGVTRKTWSPLSELSRLKNYSLTKGYMGRNSSIHTEKADHLRICLNLLTIK